MLRIRQTPMKTLRGRSPLIVRKALRKAQSDKGKILMKTFTTSLRSTLFLALIVASQAAARPIKVPVPGDGGSIIDQIWSLVTAILS